MKNNSNIPRGVLGHLLEMDRRADDWIMKKTGIRLTKQGQRRFLVCCCVISVSGCVIAYVGHVLLQLF